MSGLPKDAGPMEVSGRLSRAWRRIAESVARGLRRVADNLAPDEAVGAEPPSSAREPAPSATAEDSMAAPSKPADRLSPESAVVPDEAPKGRGDYELLTDLRVETAAHLPAFPKLVEQLRGTMGLIEEQVVGVCNRFHAIAQRSRQQVAELTRALGNDEEHQEASSSRRDFTEILNDTSEVLEDVVNQFQSAGEALDTGADRMNALHAGFDEIRIVLRRVTEMADRTKMLATNSRIEASHAGEAGRGFAIVSETMAELSVRMRETAEAIDTQIAELSEAIDSSVDAFREAADVNRDRVVTLKPMIVDVLANLSTGHEVLRDVVRSSSLTNSLLANEIHGAVVGMQFQDRANQRIGHVVDAVQQFHARIDRMLIRHDLTDPRIDERTAQVQAEIEARYTMADEHVGAAAEGGDDDGIELF
jgi:gas vesicle protein